MVISVASSYMPRIMIVVVGPCTLCLAMGMPRVLHHFSIVFKFASYLSVAQAPIIKNPAKRYSLY